MFRIFPFEMLSDMGEDYFLDEDKLESATGGEKWICWRCVCALKQGCRMTTLVNMTIATTTLKIDSKLRFFITGNAVSDEFETEWFWGLKVTSGSVTIVKDASTNMIGISIGGGAPNCPCLFIVQVFDNTPASKEGTLQSGDELLSVNNVSVKGKTKVEVAKLIQAVKGDVVINYNKLHAEASQGKSLDIILKKVKHRLVENMSSSTADALGLSRAILCNDSLVKKLAELQRTEVMYRGLVEHTQRLLRAYLELHRVIKLFGDCFAQIGVREPQPRASLAFTQFADYHRSIEKKGIDMIKKLKPVLADLGTYLHKAIPDTKLTIGKYADAKFEYLSFCLKVKEMDDEEINYASIQEPLYRVETGNYEYRLVLRCRQEARARFAQLRSDVQVKLELLDNKHVQDVATQLQKLSQGIAEFYEELFNMSKENENLFPVEVDLTDTAFIYDSNFDTLPPDEEDEPPPAQAPEEHSCSSSGTSSSQLPLF